MSVTINNDLSYGPSRDTLATIRRRREEPEIAHDLSTPHRAALVRMGTAQRDSRGKLRSRDGMRVRRG